MITPLVIYAAVTVLLALVDHLRRAKEMGKKENIDHKVSIWLGAVTAAIVFVVCNLHHPNVSFLKAALLTIAYVLGFGGVRLLLYDPAFSLFNGQNPFKNSFTSNSKTEQFENKWNIGFWWQRLAGIALCILSVLISNWIK